MRKILTLIMIAWSITASSQINILDYIAPFPGGRYPTHMDSLGYGGYRVARDTTERNAIALKRRKFGMAVYTQADSTTWILRDSTGLNVWKAQTFQGSAPTFGSDIVVKLAAGKTLGKYANGSTISARGKTLDQVFQDISTEVIHPTYVAPTSSIGSSISPGVYEIGTPLSLSLSSTFTQNDGGTATTTTYYKNGTSLGAGVTGDNIVSLTSGTSYYTVTAYNAGPRKNNNISVPDSIGQIASGTTTSNTISYTVLPSRYWGISSGQPANSDILGSVGGGHELSSSISKGAFNITVTGNTKNVFYAYPASEGPLSSIIISGLESIGTFTLSTFSVTNAVGYTQLYNVYKSNNTFSSIGVAFNSVN